jgi:hypothetical protein
MGLCIKCGNIFDKKGYKFTKVCDNCLICHCKCSWCGKDFIGKTTTAKYCCEKHRYNQHRVLLLKRKGRLKEAKEIEKGKC